MNHRKMSIMQALASILFLLQFAAGIHQFPYSNELIPLALLPPIIEGMNYESTDISAFIEINHHHLEVLSSPNHMKQASKQLFPIGHVDCRGRCLQRDTSVSRRCHIIHEGSPEIVCSCQSLEVFCKRLIYM